MTTLPFSSLERRAPLVAGIAFALPVLIAKFPPMSDLPLHEACIGLLRHWGDSVFTPPTLYFINFGHSNQLFSLAVLALSYLVPIGWATKIGVAVALVALPLCAAHFADHLGAPRWTALLVAPIGFGWLFFWGLIQNIVGLAVLLALLPAIDRFVLRPTARGATAMCGAMLLLHFAHQAMQVIATGALVVCSIGTAQRGKLVSLRLIPLAFSAALGYAANRYAWRFANWAHVQSPATLFHPLSHKLAIVSGVLFGGFEPYIRNLMMLLAMAPVALFAVQRITTGSPGTVHLVARLRGWRFEIIALGLVALYLAAPCNIKASTLVYHRFLPPAWALFAVSAAAGTRATSKLLPGLLCAVLPLASLLIAWPSFVDSNRVYTDLQTVMAHMAPGSAVLAANYSPDQGNRLWNPGVASGYVVAEHGGRAMFDYTQSPISILAQRPEKVWVDPFLRMDGHVLDMRPKWDFTRFRYFLFNTKSPGLATAITEAVKNEARRVTSQGDWYLFESTLAVVSIDADDAPVPEPEPPMLRSLFEEAVKQLQAAADADERKGSP
jgi:hypothetical protein